MNEEFQKQIEEKRAELKIDAQEEEVKATEEPVAEVETTPEVDEITKKAIEMGWDPTHKGPSFVPAKEFVERGSFFRKIDSQNKRIDELLTVVKGLDEHNRKIAHSEYKRGLQDAISRRVEAVQEGDVEKFNKAEDDLRTLNKSKPVELPNTPQPANNGVTQEMLDFVEENKAWFNNNTKENARMVAEADGLFVLESRDNPHLSQIEILKAVKEKIARLHPEAFANPNKERAPAVTPTKASSTGSKVSLAAKLTENQRSFFKKASDAGIKMTMEEYARQLDASGDLRHE
jgi:hypothetical protein